MESASSAPLRLARDPSLAEIRRPCTLVIHYDTLGTEAQAIQSAETLLRVMVVKGYGIYACRLNDKHDIEPADAS